ncbi:hypothetical protein NQ117_03015 [Paenibacillus sp. SC116]|uniref:hypothetical protein n=1 Tax=Paenibacillus sp. SC116 TaxID=2968986 RepID=UPI00215B5FFF|nr:hypothetical protein [Paenibacillus sp. SC116]MCR8842641.1 hypothetical protein [Paenibacillus sp. SC116]
MRVNTFELIPHKEGTFQLRLNEAVIAEYFYDLESNFDSLIQVDVCSHCYYPGCSDYGFVEVIDFDGYVVWKEPMNSKYVECNREFFPPAPLHSGSIVWSKSRYEELISKLNLIERNTTNCRGSKATFTDVLDLWRAEGSKLYSPFHPRCDYELGEIYQERMGLYHEHLIEEKCEHLFSKAMQGADLNIFEIVEVTASMKPIVMMFNVPSYKEWKCLYIENDEVLYSIGNGLAIRTSYIY